MDSFNLVIGTTDKEIDWEDNPYIKANVYEFDQDWDMKLSNDIKLKKC